MKKIYLLLSVFVFAACSNDNEPAATPAPEEFTGNEISYPLIAGSSHGLSGVITFRERTDGSAAANVHVQMNGTILSLTHPVHLHQGDISNPDAPVLTYLEPLDGELGTSLTEKVIFAETGDVTYTELLKLNGSVKVHLANIGPAADTVLAGGNIGAAFKEGITNGRMGIAPCGF